MATSQTSEVIQHLRSAVLLRDGAGLTDGQLLEDYISRRDDAAFAALVRRHGPMVWGVCRRVLHNHHDAEDAFQATFLVLVRKAASIVPRQMVANWLYGVAHQTALKARAISARRRARERQVTDMPEPEVAEQNLWHDLQPLLDQELSRLPDKYRVAIVLCDLEGKTYKEAARQLACPEGTFSARLARGRTMLARRLAQRGVVLSGGALAAVLLQSAASAGVPSSVVSSTIKAATTLAAGKAAAAGVISAQVATLTEGVLKTMLLTKLKVATAVLLVVALLGAGAAGLMTYQTQAGQPAKETDEATKELRNLQGTWEVIEAVNNGRTSPSENLKGNRIEFKDSQMTVVEGKDEQEPRKFRVSLDPTKRPKTIDMIALNREGKGNVLPGIYDLDGNTLTLCGPNRDMKDRPDQFKSEEGSGIVLLKLKRVKGEDAKKGGEKSKEGEADLQQIQGSWRLLLEESEKASAGMSDTFKSQFKDFRLTFKGNKLTLVRKDEKGKDEAAEDTFKLDESSSPKTIEFVWRGRKMRGVYRLNKDELRLAWWHADEPPPPDLNRTLKTSLLFKREPPSKNAEKPK